MEIDPLLFGVGSARTYLARLDVHLRFDPADPVRGWELAAPAARAVEAAASAGLDGEATFPDVVLAVDIGAAHPAESPGAWIARDVLRALRALDRVELDKVGLPSAAAVADLYARARASRSVYAAGMQFRRIADGYERWRDSGDPEAWPAAGGRSESARDDAALVEDWLEAARVLLGSENVEPLGAVAEAIRGFLLCGAFGEENGRVARLLIPLLLRGQRLTREACCFVSPALAKSTSEVRTAALADPREWALLFFRAVRTAARAIEEGIVAIDRERRSWHERFRLGWPAYRSTSAVPAAIDWVLRNPVFTTPILAKAIGCTLVGTRQGVLPRLVEIGAVEESTGRSRYRFYTASRILDAAGRRI